MSDETHNETHSKRKVRPSSTSVEMTQIVMRIHDLLFIGIVEATRESVRF